MSNKIFIIGGHPTPAFAVIDESLKNNVQKDRLVWIGEKYNQKGNQNSSPEYQTVIGKYNLKHINFKSGKLIRKWTFSTFLQGLNQFLLLVVGFLKAFYLIAKYRPQLVLSFGGFTAVPIVIWGNLLGSKVITHEQTLTTGLANKIIARFADIVLVSWEQTVKNFNVQKVMLTGNPIRNAIFKTESDLVKDLEKKLPLIYITGGNQGAHEINKVIFEAIPILVEAYNVIHQTGNSTATQDFNKANNLKLSLDEKFRDRYVPTEYIDSENIGGVINKASVVVSRAGANTITELIATGKSAILVPIPWSSQNEQEKNADLMVDLGLGIKLLQEETFTPKELIESIRTIMNEQNQNKDLKGNDLNLSKKKAKELIKLDAAKKIAEIIFNQI